MSLGTINLSHSRNSNYREASKMPESQMTQRTVIKKFPFTIWAILALILYAAIRALGLSYDDGGLGSVLILSAPLWGFMYWLPGEVLFALSNNHSVFWHWLISAISGLAICFLADTIIHRLRLAKATARANHSRQEGD
jgi:hypothetical protein